MLTDIARGLSPISDRKMCNQHSFCRSEINSGRNKIANLDEWDRLSTRLRIALIAVYSKELFFIVESFHVENRQFCRMKQLSLFGTA